MRILIRPRLPVLALLFLAPSIPELLTGSTPVSRLWSDPLAFAIGYLADVTLYGTGALLIRETTVALRKGWASVLLWGAAYGVAEEGLAVHTFFERSGPPVGALTSYGSAYGVNALWALGLTIFHATYSIALPILLTYLWFPEVKARRWVDPSGLAVTAAVYVAVVAMLAALVGHGPSPSWLAAFLGVEVALVGAGVTVPRDLLRPRAGSRTVGRVGLAIAGSLEWLGWVTVLLVSGGDRIPAVAAAGVLALANGGALAVVLRHAGTADLDRSEFAFAVGMLVPLFVWDAILEVTIPGILGVAAIFALWLYGLGRTVDQRVPGPEGEQVPGPA